MKPKKEEASEALTELGDVVEDTEEIKMTNSCHYENLLMHKSRYTTKKRGGRYN